LVETRARTACNSRNEDKEQPVPPNTPEIRIDRSLFRALRSFDANRLSWLDRAAEAGPLTQLRFGPVRIWSVTDPDMVRQMLISDAASWERPPAAVIPIRLGIGENLFTMPDDAWEHLQPQVAPGFRKRALDSRLSSMESIIDDSVSSIPRDRPFDVELTMGALALRLAAWVLFGDRLPPERAMALATHQQRVVTWVGRRAGQMRSVVPFAPGRAAREMRRHQSELNRYADELLTKLSEPTGALDPTQDADRANVGSHLSRAHVAGKAMPREQLRSQILGLLLAGNETTAAALTWAMVNGARHPDQWARLRHDHTAVRPYLDETLRLTPAVWGFARRPKVRGAMLGGQRIGRTEVVTIYLRGMNRDPTRWVDPLQFSPDRHRSTSPLDATMLSFGLGPRGCIGQHLAMAEMLAILPVLAAAGNVSLASPEDLVEDASFALRIQGGLQATLTPVS
jgi:cytochrome P450